MFFGGPVQSLCALRLRAPPLPHPVPSAWPASKTLEYAPLRCCPISSPTFSPRVSMYIRCSYSVPQATRCVNNVDTSRASILLRRTPDFIRSKPAKRDEPGVNTEPTNPSRSLCWLAVVLLAPLVYTQPLASPARFSVWHPSLVFSFLDRAHLGCP